MQTRIASLARGAAGLMLGVALSAGCAGDGGTAEETEPTTPVELTEQVGATEESLTSVDMVDCSICATARACCTAVSTTSYCNNFDAERCATLDPGRMRRQTQLPGTAPRRRLVRGALPGGHLRPNAAFLESDARRGARETRVGFGRHRCTVSLVPSVRCSRGGTDQGFLTVMMSLSVGDGIPECVADR